MPTEEKSKRAGVSGELMKVKKQTIRATPGTGLISASGDDMKERRVLFSYSLETLAAGRGMVRAGYLHLQSLRSNLPFRFPSVSLPASCWGFEEFTRFCKKKSLTRQRTFAL